MGKYRGEIGLLVVTLIWGFGFPVTNIALRQITPYQLMALRFSIAAVLLSIIFHKSLRKLNRQNMARGAIIGVLLFAGFLLQTIGMKYTTPSKSAFLTATNVVMVPLIGVLFFRQKIDRYSVFGAVFALIGTAVLSFRPDLSVNVGDVLSLLCAAAFAGHIYFTGHFLSGDEDPLCLTVVQMAVSAALSLLLAAVPGAASGFLVLPRGVWLPVFYLGVVSTTCSFLLQTVSQKYVNSQTRAAVIMSMEAVFGTLASILIVREIIGPRMVAGSVIILAGVLLSELGAGMFGRFRIRESARQL